MKTKKEILSVLAIILGLAMIACLTFGLTACEDDDNTVGDSKNVLAAPTDFTIDLDTGEFSFIANDENAGYYFVRCYAVINGVEKTTYTATSARINGGSTGTMTGSFDLSSIGWGEYNFKLSTYPAAGSDYSAPAPVVLTVQKGIGGVMETPALAAFYSGNRVQLVIDWHTLTNYYAYQTMPIMRFDFYSASSVIGTDAGSGTTTVDVSEATPVLTTTVDTSELLDTVDQFPPALGDYIMIWGYNTETVVFKEMNVDGQDAEFEYDSYNYYAPDDLAAGEYYVTATALSTSSDIIQDSNTSDAVYFKLTESDPTGTDYNGSYGKSYSEAWEAPTAAGKPQGPPDTSRENNGATQETTSRFI